MLIINNNHLERNYKYLFLESEGMQYPSCAKKLFTLFYYVALLDAF